ncbi:MAG: hypothetical protein QOI95_3453 [Acidimicrobiaceae bacterium]
MTKGLLFAHRLSGPLDAMTGIGRYVIEMTRALAALGSETGWSYDIASTREREVPEWLPAGVGRRVVPWPRKAVHLSWTLLDKPRLERLVGPADVLHALQPSFPIPTQLPAVMTVHDLIPREHPEWHGRVERWGFRHAIDELVNRNWHVIADSRYVARELEAVGVPESHINVVPLAISDPFRNPPAHDTRASVCSRYGIEPGHYVLAVGRVSARKNLVLLVEAFAAIPQRDLVLVIAGSSTGQEADRVRRACDRLDIVGRVRFIGFVSDEDLPALVAAALMFVYPSLDEGFGLPPLEAMAAGTPVVAANAGSVPEIVGDAALLVDPTDRTAWTDAIDRVADDEALRGMLAAAGRHRAAAFTWERAAEQTMAVHRAALENR